MPETSARCPLAIASHSGTDSASDTSIRPGWRITASPCANVSTNVASTRAIFCGSTRSMPRTSRPMRSGCPASANRTPPPAIAAAAATRPPTLTRANSDGSPPTAPGPAVSTKNANNIRTVMRSSRRSRMIVANAAVAFRFSRRARRYGRRTSPARAGSRNEAAKPMTVIRNAVAEVGAADGRQEILPAQGPDRVGHACDRDCERQRPRIGAAGLRPDVRHVHTAEKDAQQPEGQQENEGVPDSWLHAAGQ